MHNVDNKLAKKIINDLKMTEKEYRKVLSKLRTKINIVEKNLTNRTYENIDFSSLPTKAMMKYTAAFMNNMKEEYSKYKNQVKNGESKINTNGLFAYEIIKKILFNQECDEELYDIMWNNQKDFLNGCTSNILVMADTSGSMMSYGGIPYATSAGLALYTAERNNGIFKNHFITFSDRPYLCEVKGKTIKDKVKNIPSIIANTDIDKAFELILKASQDNNLKDEELPSHLLIISDMEFDQGVYSQNGTNLEGWRKEFSEAGYKLPIIIFWNVAGNTKGVPTTKFDNDVALISGFSTNILENLLTLENYTPISVMLEKLDVYMGMLKESNK